MKKLFVLIALFVGTSAFAGSSFRLDERAIESMFDMSEDMTVLLGVNNPFNTSKFTDNPDVQTAAIIAFVTTGVRWFAGSIFWIPYVGLLATPLLSIASIFPWHRYYLGTGGEGFKLSVFYCATLGWCINAHHVVDGIMLLTNDNADSYIDNPRYVMWAN